MAEVIAIENPLIFLISPADASKIFRRTKDRAEELAVSLRTSEKEKLVKEVVDNAIGYLSDRLKRQDLRTTSDGITLFVAKSHSHFAEKFYEELPDGKIKNSAIISVCTDEENRPTGLTNARRRITCINTQQIEINCRDDKHPGNASQEERERSSLVLTTIHELLHHFGDFGENVDFNGQEYPAEWLNEGIPEFLARETMKGAYPRDFEKLGWRDLQEYMDAMEAVRDLISLVGERTVTDAFISGNFGIIARKAKEIHVSDKLEELLRNPFRKKKEQEEDLEGDTGGEAGTGARAEKRYGCKLAEPASEAMAAFRELPADVRLAAFERAAARLFPLNLLMTKPETPAISNWEEAEAYLTTQYNPPRTKFFIEQLIGIAKNYLELDDARAGPSDVVAFIESKAFEHQAGYGVKPTLKQLMDFVGDGVMAEYAHKKSITEDYGAAFGKNEMGELREAIKITLGIIGNELFLWRNTQLALKAAGVESDEFANDTLLESCLLLERRLNRPDPTFFEVVMFLSVARMKYFRDKEPVKASDLNEKLKAERWSLNYPKELSYAAVSPQDGIAYLAKHPHGKPSHEKAEKLARLCGHLQFVYPSKRIVLEPENGILLYGRYNRIDSYRAERICSGYVSRFAPYGRYGAPHKENGDSNPFAGLLGKHGLPKGINPLFSGERVKEAARKTLEETEKEMTPARMEGLAGASRKQATAGWLLIKAFEKFSVRGQLGIRYDEFGHRPNGCFNAEEVLQYGYSLCLERAYMVIALMHELEEYVKNVIVVKVHRWEHGDVTAHACNAVLLPKMTPVLDSNAAEIFGKPRLQHYRFERDGDFRKRLLDAAGMADDKETSMVLIDFTTTDFAPQYQEISIMTKTDLLSAYFTNKGTYHMRHGDARAALESFETASAINPQDELALSHRISYYSEVELDPARIVELSENYALLINTEDLLSRALALVILGRVEDGIEAALRARQLSNNYKRADVFLQEIGFAGYLQTR
jgi:hypothetical protein